MTTTNTLEFGHADRKEIYEYVERRGAVDPEETRDQLGLDPGGFRHHIAILKRDGRIEEEDGTLRVTINAGAEEEYVSEALEFHIRPARQEDLTGIVGAIRQVAEAPWGTPVLVLLVVGLGGYSPLGSTTTWTG